jgi:hypothetical protein
MAHIQRESRQQLRDQVSLMQAKFVALAPSEERATGMRRINHVLEPTAGVQPRHAMRALWQSEFQSAGF